MIQLVRSTVERQLERLCRYTLGLGLVDTYWENMILQAQFYEIHINGVQAGFFTYLEEAQALTSFYLENVLSPAYQTAFMEIQRRLHPRVAYLVTSDEPFLSLCFDCGKRFEAHGFFFDDSGSTYRPAEIPAWQIRPAEESDTEELRNTGFYGESDLFDPENRIYVLRDTDGVFMGTGHIALWMRKLRREWGAVGMYTVPEFRGRGVGRSIILAMKELTRQMGVTPIAGCYCKNLASKRTLESCGFITKTRYIKAYFAE